MKWGGTGINIDTWMIFRKMSLFVPVLLVVYNIFLAYYPEYASTFYEPAFANVFVALWFGIALLSQLSDPAVKRQQVFITFVYHVLAFMYILLIAGVGSPLTLFWALLIAIGYILFGIVGTLASILLLALCFAVDKSFTALTFSGVLFDVFFISVVTMVGFTIIYLLRVENRKQLFLISSQQKERQQHSSMETLINNISDGVLSLTNRGAIQLYNAAAVNLLDTNLRIMGLSVDKVLKLQTEDGSSVKLAPLLKKSTSLTSRDDLFIPVGDERIRVELRYSPVRNSYENTAVRKNDGFVIIFRDITKAKSLEEERDEFISVVSHELRTPIAITEGSLDNARLIFEKDPSKVSAVTSSLDMAHEQVLFLAKMVNDLSTLSRAERGVADESEVIDLSELAAALQSEYAPQATEKGLTLSVEKAGVLTTVTASRLYLQELLQNFITNAIKYTKEGSILVRIEENDGTVHFSVKDSGIGISKADQQKIFDKFYRSEDYRTRETGGTGLGLYVSAKLAKKLGCRIDVKSRLNHGSTFSFTLPASK